MDGQYAEFQYRSLPEIPKQLRQVDWTYINVRDKSFSEAEEAFDQMRNEYSGVFSDRPFAYLHFLRAIEDRLVILAVEKRQPIHKVLECLRRRLDLEYSRVDIYSKAAQLLIISDYAVECGEIELSKKLLKEERNQLNETAEICHAWIDTIDHRKEG
jgi:hypothetical protein